MPALPRGTCRVCHADVALRSNGKVREHPDHRHELYGVGRGAAVPKCPGSAELPGERPDGWRS